MFIKDQDEMSSPYKGSAIDASYHVSLHLGRRFQKIFFLKSTNWKQELPVAAMLINGLGRNEHFYRGPSIDASYQVSVHLVKRL